MSINIPLFSWCPTCHLDFQFQVIKTMKISILTILILIAILQPVYTSSSADLIDFHDRWALLIGVGQYSAESGIGQLNYPADDINVMRQMLIQYGGFSEDHIKTLSESQATYRGVNEEFQKLKGKVQSEDLVVFYFSGRGSRVKDNIFIDAETDRLDECFLLYDTILGEDETPISNYIRDDEIGKHLKRLGAKQSVVIIDACYQGNNAEEKGVTASSTTSDSIVYDGMSGDFLPVGTVVLEACAPNETTSDGAFTSLLTELATSGNNDIITDGIITMEEFHVYVNAEDKLSRQKPRLVDPESRAAQVSLVNPLLEVISQPAGAMIFVDDKERGATPTHLVLPIGRHKLEVRKRGYYVWDNAGSLIEIIQPGTQQPLTDIVLTPVQVTGEVRFRDSNLPVKGATVVILGARNIPPATTDEQGRFLFDDWSQADFSENAKYEIRVSDESERFQAKSQSLKDLLSDLTSDISLEPIMVDRQITVTVKVTNAARNIPMPNAVVQLDQQQIMDDNRDGVFETHRINPLDSVTLQVYQEGYETTDGDDVYAKNITITPETHEYTRQVKLTPAFNIYSAEVTNQSDEPVAGVIVILNGEQLGDATNRGGIAEGQRHLAPDEQISLQLQKDGYELFNGSILPERLEYRRYRLSISLVVTPISLLVVDEGNKPVKGVQINTDGRLTATTDANGKATISVYRPPNTEVSLDVIYASPKREITKATKLQVLEGGGFKMLEPGFAEVIGATLKIHLPLPPEVILSVTVQEQDKKPIPGMTVMVNGKAYGEKTALTGKSDISFRIAIDENTPPKLEFERYGKIYEPQETDFRNIGTNKYTAFVNLQISYGKIELTADTKVAEQKINLFVNAEVSLDEETKTHRLPATMQVFPGTHQLRILIDDVPLYGEQLTIAENETKPIPLTLPLSDAWRACLTTLRDAPNDAQVLQSAEEIARALGRYDLAQTFRKRR